MKIAGIELGAKNTKTVIMEEEKILAKSSVYTEFDLAMSLENSLEKSLAMIGISREQIDNIGVSGSAKSFVEIHNKYSELVNEVEAMLKGARFFFPKTGTAIDVGCEEGRAAKLEPETGKIVDFVYNEECAAGAGSFIDTMSRVLAIDHEEMGSLALQSDKKISMNTQCAIFAEAEVKGQMYAQTPQKDICKAINDALASRIVSMLTYSESTISVKPRTIFIF